MTQGATTHFLRRNIIRLCALMVFAAACLLVSSRSEARLQAYYVLRGFSFGQIKPRILFVVDTSGSMAWVAENRDEVCTYWYCEEGEGAQLSRIAAARRAIRFVVDNTGELAEYALMTFNQQRPPSSGGQVPSKCPSGGRFQYATYYTDPVVWDYWRSASQFGYRGRWVLCGDNKPYPYLRWDNLGVGSVISSNNRTGTVPASPLISTSSSNYGHSSNGSRKVQWFPDFLGVRVNLNFTTDPDQDILGDTYGDYGTTNSTRLANVWKHDFYYWPYVDGFPGYSFFAANVSTDGKYYDMMGVAQSDGSSGASLYAPFYLDVDDSELNPNVRGPTTWAAAEQKIRDYSSKMSEGGIDVEGGTPWKSTIGPVISSPPKSNSPFAHTTVASYIGFLKNFTPDEMCVPVVSVLITDGEPSPSTEGGYHLYKRLSDLRRDLDNKVYVVGFAYASASLNDMACAGAGSDNYNYPCYGTPTNKWDTCETTSDPTRKCAFLAANPKELADVLIQIVEAELKLTIDSGPGFSVNEFGVGAGGNYGAGDTVQTLVAANTEWPDWKGHVSRELCNDADLDDPTKLAGYCENKPFEEPDAETFGVCPLAREWDAGECLKLTDWKARRLYVNLPDNKVVRLNNADGTATTDFYNQLNAADLAIPGAPFTKSQANNIAAFILGKGWPDGWKLPGLAQSSPIVVRRIPKKSSAYSPSVGIRDPHCAGRRLDSRVDIPTSLEAYALESWDEERKLPLPSPHLESQEAVLVGDDLGLLHAFHLDSGNELWAFLPRYLIKSAVESFQWGADVRGQPESLADHVYGLGGTLNHTWVFDEDAREGRGKWRHLAVIGAAQGGSFLMALDLNHMSPNSPEGPIEILWTSEDSDKKAIYRKYMGETWARPAITYHVPNEDVGREPKAYMVFTSGYADPVPTSSEQGRTIFWVDAVSGDILNGAILPTSSVPTYDTGVAAVSDPAVTTHCVSRYWAETQETYFNDPAGRLYRWDLARDTEHAADSGGKWSGTAIPAATFLACQGKDDFACSVGAGNKADPFFFPPAVVSNNRIDELEGATPGILPDAYRDQFLIAMVSGSLLDDATDSGVPDADFHPSIYVLVDDHRKDPHGGLKVPLYGQITEAGKDSDFFRIPLSSLKRTRTFRPFDGSPTYTEVGYFSRRTRPIRAPRITVTGLIDNSTGEVVDGVEVYYIEYVVFEPPSGECDADWFDTSKDEWHVDKGSTYTIRLRLLSRDGEGFDLVSGSGSEYGDITDSAGFSTDGLDIAQVQQMIEGDCEDGVCGPSKGTMRQKPCDPNISASHDSSRASISLGYKELEGFSPVEVEVSGD